MIYRFLDVWCRSFETEPLVGEPQGGKWVIVQREGCVGERWRECQGKSRFPGVAVADGQPGSEHEPVYGESSCDIVPRVVNSVPRVWRQLPRMQIYRPHCTLIHRQFTLCGAFRKHDSGYAYWHGMKILLSCYREGTTGRASCWNFSYRHINYIQGTKKGSQQNDN